MVQVASVIQISSPIEKRFWQLNC